MEGKDTSLIVGWRITCWHLILLVAPDAACGNDSRACQAHQTTLVIPAKPNRGDHYVEVELTWREVRNAPGGIKIDHWKNLEGLSAMTKAQLIGKLKFDPPKPGAMAQYNSNSTYFFYLGMSGIDPKKTWKPHGKIKVGRKVFACGYHEVEVKYVLFRSATKAFTIVANELVTQEVTDVRFASGITLVGTGMIRLRIGKPPGMGVHIFAEATLGGKSTTHEKANWMNANRVNSVELLNVLGLDQ